MKRSEKAKAIVGRSRRGVDRPDAEGLTSADDVKSRTKNPDPPPVVASALAPRLRLPPGEAERLVALAQTGNTRARDRVVQANLGIVHSRVNVRARADLPWRRADLFQEGILGVMRAIELYDPSFGSKFASYARIWVDQFLARWDARQRADGRHGGYHLQQNYAGKFLEYQRLRSIGVSDDDAVARVAAAAEEPVPRMRRILRELATFGEVSLETPCGETRVLGDLFAAGDPEDDRSREERMDQARDDAKVRALVMTAAEPWGVRGRVIARERLLQDPPATLQAIGTRFGVSRERVRQIEAKIVKRVVVALGMAGFGSAESAIPARRPKLRVIEGEHERDEAAERFLAQAVG